MSDSPARPVAPPVIVDGIPAELRERAQWALWQYELVDGRWTKVPYQAADPERKASTTKPATWASFAAAYNESDFMDGVGFVFADTDPYTGVDLDGFDEDERQEIVELLSSYTERSVNGGLHVIVKGRLPSGGRHPEKFGVFDRGRYFVMTGDHVDGTPTTIEERQAELDEFLDTYLPASEPASVSRPAEPVDLPDRELLERAFAARNGPAFQRLHDGDTTGYSSPSEADLAYCRTAAFWTGGDPARIDAWLRSSGLCRDKWERDDYRQRTIDAAIAATTDVYTPPAAASTAATHEPTDGETNGEPFTIDTLTARQLDELPEPDGDARLLGHYVTRLGRTVIVGDTGEGKTTVAMQFVRGIVTGDQVLGQTGAGEGPALILDLEQGLRSAKRAVRAAGLHERDDVHVARCPDGLALDADSEHVDALRALLDRLRPVVVVLDPYYKAHRNLEPNEERGVVLLMRFLDGLRVDYEFALILLAHPRKDQPGRSGIRKLTIHDVAGSGALTRGAEVVLAIERGNPGYARLRVLKDRDGDLEVGKAVGLIFNREDGFQLDPREHIEQAELDHRTLEFSGDGKWRTASEFRKKLGVALERVKETLDRLTEDGMLEFEQGPDGRSSKAKCWRATELGGSDKSNSVVQSTVPGTPSSGTELTDPTGYREPVGFSSVAATSPTDLVPNDQVECSGGGRDAPGDEEADLRCVQTGCDAPRVPGAFYCPSHGGVTRGEAEEGDE
jgi:hypothetical protein